MSRRRAGAAIAAATTGIISILIGAALIYPPAAFILAGIGILGALTFDPTRAGRLTWPR